MKCKEGVVLEDANKKKEIVEIETDMEYYPVALRKNEVSVERYAKFPLAKVSALGTAFEPLTQAFQKTVLGNSGGGSGLYRVTVSEGGRLANFKGGSEFLGTVLSNETNQIVGQARLKPLVCNPAMLFMAAALMSIDKKLDDIQEIQKEIIEFLEQEKKSKLRGNLSFMTDVINRYKHNRTNENYKKSNYIKILDIKQDSKQSILFYRAQIDRKIEKQSFVHSDSYVKEKLQKIQSEFEEYQLALYLYAFASLLEVMLLENFESAYLDDTVCNIQDYALQYRELYTECFNQIEEYSKSSVQSHLLRGLANASKAAGSAAAKIPVVNKSKIDEALVETGSRLGKFKIRRTQQGMASFANIQSSTVYPFIEIINAVNRLHNQPIELLFDEENIYLSL
jgi:hypothetical protein